MASFIDTAIPIILVGIVLGFLFLKLKKPLGVLYGWIKELFKSKKHKEEPNTYSYVDYDG